MRSLFVGNHDHKKKNPCETGWGRDQFVRIYLVKKGFIEVNISYATTLSIKRIFNYKFLKKNF